MRRTLTRTVALTALVGLAFTACDSDDEPSDDPAEEPADPPADPPAEDPGGTETLPAEEGGDEGDGGEGGEDGG